MTLIDIIRAEAQRLAESHCGLKYLMAHLGEIDDFRAGLILNITREDRGGVPSNYREMLAMGNTDEQVREISARDF